MTSKLQHIWDLYHEYVAERMTFDEVVDDIMGFDEYAEAHHGVPREEANEFFAQVAG